MDNSLSITSVIIKRIANSLTCVKAYVTLTLNDCLVIHNIKLLEYSNGKRHLAFPSTKVEQNGVVTFSDIVHPINSDFRNYVEDLVFNLYDSSKSVNDKTNEELNNIEVSRKEE